MGAGIGLSGYFLLGKSERELSGASERFGDAEDHPAFALQT